MKFPLYLYYELLVRITEFRPDVGEYLSVFAADSYVLVNTSTGFVEIPTAILYRQFNDPDTISIHEIKQLSREFRSNNLTQSKAG